MIQYPRYKRHRFSSFQIIIAGFAAVDLVGALLLMLPIAAQQRCVTPFHEALFTSTSALCVAYRVSVIESIDLNILIVNRNTVILDSMPKTICLKERICRFA